VLRGTSVLRNVSPRARRVDPHPTTRKLKQLHENKPEITRVYGGFLSGPVVRDRIISGFVEEEPRAAPEKKAQSDKKKGKWITSIA
jgi:hypothetical protein